LLLAPSALPSDDLRCVARAKRLRLQLSPFQPLTGEGGVASMRITRIRHSPDTPLLQPESGTVWHNRQA
jgi:hypothetical protein